MRLLGCAGCVRTVDFVEPFRARFRVGAWIVFASVLVEPPALLVWVVFR